MKVHRRDGSDPTRIHEVVASPLTLLDTGPTPSLQNTTHPLNNPFFFPPDITLSDPTVTPSVVDYERHLPPNDGDRLVDHFMTLSFTTWPESGSVWVRVRGWLIRSRDGTTGLPELAFERPFLLDAGRLPTDGSVPHRTVSAVVANTDGDITALADSGSTWSPRLLHEAIRDIEGGLARYFVDGRFDSHLVEREIHVVRDRVRNIVYLRAHADDEEGNNLDQLPRLLIRDWH